jgi:hypothetical protein
VKLLREVIVSGSMLWKVLAPRGVLLWMYYGSYCEGKLCVVLSTRDHGYKAVWYLWSLIIHVRFPCMGVCMYVVVPSSMWTMTGTAVISRTFGNIFDQCILPNYQLPVLFYRGTWGTKCVCTRAANFYVLKGGITDKVYAIARNGKR